MKDKKEKKPLFKKREKVEVIHKIFIYVVVVAHGYGDKVVKLMQHCGSNVQYICLGRGTANREVKQLLGVEDNRKDVVLALIDETNIEDTKTQLAKRISAEENALGFAFTLPLDSIIGEKIYHFLTNTL